MRNNQKTSYIKIRGLIFVLFLMLAFSVLFAISVGSNAIPLNQVLKGIGQAVNFLDKSIDKDKIYDVVVLIRAPRAILAVLVGIGLSYSGVVMQAIMKNPIADPYILGISSGAYLGAVLAIMLGVGSQFWGPEAIGICAFIGALITCMLILLVSQIGGKISSLKLLLTGMAISFVAQAIANFVVFIANNREGMRTLTFWTMGSLAGAKWQTNLNLGLIVIIGLFIFCKYFRILDLMLLGDDQAITLGTNLSRYRIFFLVIISIVIGYVVYAAGIIGFIGLIVPHFARLIVGSNHRFLVLVSSLLGGLIMVWADICSRILIPNTEVPIGIIISLIGAPIFTYLLISKAYREGDE